MKIEVTITIDGNETATQIAFAKFLNEIAGVRYPTATLEVIEEAKHEKATAPAADLAPEKPLRAEKKKAVALVKEEAPEPVAESPESGEEKEPETVTATAPATAPVIDIVTLRKMVSERAANHRGAMREKLTELNAENVSSLPEEKYTEFYNFLLTLD